MNTQDSSNDRLADLERRLEKLERLVAGGATPPAKSKRLSAKEFLLGKPIKTETQKVLALAFFLERFERLESFNVSDLEAVFRSAREKLPKNINDAVNKNVARGFVMEAAEKKDSKKAWHLTATGEQHVERELK